MGIEKIKILSGELKKEIEGQDPKNKNTEEITEEEVKITNDNGKSENKKEEKDIDPNEDIMRAGEEGECSGLFEDPNNQGTEYQNQISMIQGNMRK